MADKLTDEDVAELERLCAAATPEPWDFEPGDWPHKCHTVITARRSGMTARSPLALISDVLGSEEAAKDAAFIVRARTAIPALLSALRRQRVRIGLLESAAEVAKDGIRTLHQHGNFQNGVTDPANTIDEGDVSTAHYVDHILGLINTALATGDTE